MSIFFKNAFGLDIGDTSLKLVWLDKKKFIKSYNEVILPEGAMERGVIKDQAGVVETIKKLISTAKGDGIKTNRVCACLPEPKTFIKIIKIPATVKKAATRDFILDEIYHYLPMRADEIYIDWQKFSQEKPTDDLTKVLVGAVSKEVADNYFTLLSSAGLEVESLQIEAASIANALVKEKRKAGGAAESAPRLIIDLGANRSSLILFDRETIQFSISIPISGLKMTKEISEKSHISFAEAEEKKIDHGLSDVSSPVYKIIDENLKVVVEEIKKSAEFYNRESGKSVKQILLCGGGAAMEDLSGYLKSKTNLEVFLGDPLINLKFFKTQKIKFEGNPLSFTTAIGLALSGLEI